MKRVEDHYNYFKDVPDEIKVLYINTLSLKNY